MTLGRALLQCLVAMVVVAVLHPPLRPQLADSARLAVLLLTPTRNLS